MRRFQTRKLREIGRLMILPRQAQEGRGREEKYNNIGNGRDRALSANHEG